LSSREAAAFVSGVVKDAFSLWLNAHPELGMQLAELAISNAGRRLKASKKVERKRITQGPALPGKLADCAGQDPMRSELQEVHNIAVAIGVDPGAADMSQLRYGKICILADADSDGLHIATLLCALFVQHFRPLVDAGHVYVAMPPLYRIDLGKDI
nr:DNA gyrase subunit B, chloroplastic/mitochondrial [Tanacetum cinerariifolium]